VETPRSIGLLCRGWAPDGGGVESHTLGLAQSLLEHGVCVEVLCTGHDPEAPSYAVGDWHQAGVRVRRMNLRGSAPNSLESMDSDPRADARVREWLDHTQPDIVHVHHLSGFGFGALTEIARQGVALVVTLHDYWTLCPRGQMFTPAGDTCTRVDGPTCSQCIADTWPGLVPSAEEVCNRLERARRALTLAHRLIVPSRAAAQVMRRAGFEGLHFDCVPNALDATTLAREVTRLRAGRPVGKRLGVIGAVQPSKGALELAQALVQANVPGLVLDVHGHLADYHGNTEYVDALKALARSDSRIRLHGPFEMLDLPRVLATLDAVAVPSLWEEVYGLGAREARGVGLPVMVAGRGGLTEWKEDAGVTVVSGAGVDVWIEHLIQFDFVPTAPAHGRSTSQPGGGVLDLYAGVLPSAAPRGAGPRVGASAS